MSLRAALPGDAAILAALHATSFETSWDAVEFAQLLDGPGAFGLLIETSGFIVCRALAGEAEVLTLAVDPGARGQGLGRALMTAAMGLARTAGAETVFLEVAADNPAAIALYEALGFERIGLRPGYYARRGGSPVDALVYRRSLFGETAA